MTNDTTTDTTIDYSANSGLLSKIILIFAAVFTFIISRYAFMFFLAGILPSLLVMAWDAKHPHKCASATVSCFNLIGILPYLIEMWRGSSINESAKIMIGDMKSWLYIYGITMVGYVFYIVMPLMISKLFLIRFEFSKRELVDRRKQICDDWDIDFSEFTIKDKQ